MNDHRLYRFLVLLLLATAAVSARAQDPTTGGWIARETARTYRAEARYPPHVRALAAGSEDPIVAERTPSPITVAPGEGDRASLTVWPARVAFVAPAPIDLYAELHDLTGKSLAGDIAGDVVAEDGTLITTVRFFDDGLGPDHAAGDGRYSTRVDLPPRLTHDRAESYLVRISGAARNDRGTRHATTGFQRSWPGARLTGRYRDRLVHGDLSLGAEVQVTRPGRYHLTATLVAVDGSPIGMAQTAAHLAPGSHWLELEYYGLVFRDRGVRGPYQVAAITLTDASAMPNALGDVQRNVHITRAYALRRFTHRPFGDLDLLDAARRLETDADRAAGRP